VSGPLPPLFTVSTDIARQSTLEQVLAALADLTTKVDALMSEDSTVAAEVAAEETDLASLTSSYQALAAALANEDNLSPATLTALAAFKTQLDSLTGTAAADVPAAAPPVTGT
jgi:ABC-type transporter Mla subunit MlaD